MLWAFFSVMSCVERKRVDSLNWEMEGKGKKKSPKLLFFPVAHDLSHMCFSRVSLFLFVTSAKFHRIFCSCTLSGSWVRLSTYSHGWLTCHMLNEMEQNLSFARCLLLAVIWLPSGANMKRCRVGGTKRKTTAKKKVWERGFREKCIQSFDYPTSL